MVNFSTMITSVILFVVSIIISSGFIAGISLIVFIVSLCQVRPYSKETETIRYQCEICGKEFKYADDCKKHEKEHGKKKKSIKKAGVHK